MNTLIGLCLALVTFDDRHFSAFRFLLNKVSTDSSQNEFYLVQDFNATNAKDLGTFQCKDL